jgi:amidase/aspartyl-tRNA(Asn)/glutamyl-tRNA(Gln) amidotransferase subunit A
VAELADRIRRRDLSPVEVLDHFIARIESLNPRLNALVLLEFEEAREGAKLAERKVMSGEGLGPLHGVPLAMKDCFDFKPGWRNTFGGVRALKDYVASSWSLFPERVERAGAIILGKANSPTFGFRGTCDNYLFGPTRNPFNPSKNSGGSSGGSAAAVAAGLLPFAEGGDGGGSIRIPAAWCGVYGFKHSFGRVPLRLAPNFFGGLNPFIFEGALTRSVEDAALILKCTAGYHPDDPFSVESSEDYSLAAKRSIRGMKVAYSRNFGIYPVEEVIGSHIDQAVRAFEDAGAFVEEVDIGIKRSQRELSDVWCRLIIPNSLLALESLRSEGFELLRDHAEDFPPQFRLWLDRGCELTALDQLRDQVIRSEIYAAIQKVLARFDLIVTPTLACMPVGNAADGNTVGPSSLNGETVDPLIGWCLTYLINFTGHPAASIPAGLSPDALPIGMQIIGRRYADADVLAASAAFEQARPWAGDYRVAANVIEG